MDAKKVRKMTSKDGLSLAKEEREMIGLRLSSFESPEPLEIMSTDELELVLVVESTWMSWAVVFSSSS